MEVSGVSAAALGGKMATNSVLGAGDAYSITLPYLSATAQSGESGYPNVTLPIYSGADKIVNGRGGQSPFAAQNFGQGEITTIVGSDFNYYRGTSGTSPGGGAGRYGNNGGDGYVIIRWN